MLSYIEMNSEQKHTHSETLESNEARSLDDSVKRFIGACCVSCLLQENDRMADLNSRLTKNNQELTDEVNTDSRTGLASSSMLERTIEQMISKGEGFGVLFIDLSSFGMVNIRKDHEYGNEMLRLTGSYLREQLRKDDVVLTARYGGDEFCVLLANNGRSEKTAEPTNLSLEQRLEAVSQRLASEYISVDEIWAYNQTYNNVSPLGMLIKHAVWSPGMDRKTLLQNADPKANARLQTIDDSYSI